MFHIHKQLTLHKVGLYCSHYFLTEVKCTFKNKCFVSILHNNMEPSEYIVAVNYVFLKTVDSISLLGG